MNRVEALRIIAAQVGKGDLNFPTSIDVALKVQRALDDPDCSVDQAARLVQSEPMLSARTVAIANSVAYNRSGREVSDVRTAVSRLGFRTLRSLAMAVITRQMAGMPAQVGLRQMAAELWEHTAHVASLASVIAKRVTKIDAETAFFAGVVHEVGSFYLISRAEDYPGLLDGTPEEWEENGEHEVGRAVLSKLQVPDTVLEGVEGLWQGYLALPPVSLADTLLLADSLAPVESPLHRLREARSIDSLPVIDSQVGEETLSDILSEASEEVSSLFTALHF